MNPVEIARALAHPRTNFWKSGSVKICSKIKPDYMSLKLIQNTRLGEMNLTTTGSYFIWRLLSLKML